MEASVSSHVLGFPSSNTLTRNVAASPKHSRSELHFNCTRRDNRLIGTRRLKTRISAINEVSSVTDPAEATVTWQIVVGAIAGVAPFVVAGIEFSKRIVAQRKCKVCGGSGLVLRDKKYYFRCPGCGGFLPWQSWKRFFSAQKKDYKCIYAWILSLLIPISFFFIKFAFSLVLLMLKSSFLDKTLRSKHQAAC